MTLLTVELTIQGVLISVLSVAILVIAYFLKGYIDANKEKDKQHDEFFNKLNDSMNALTKAITRIDEGFHWFRESCADRHQAINSRFTSQSHDIEDLKKVIK